MILGILGRVGGKKSMFEQTYKGRLFKTIQPIFVVDFHSQLEYVLEKNKIAFFIKEPKLLFHDSSYYTLALVENKLTYVLCCDNNLWKDFNKFWKEI